MIAAFVASCFIWSFKFEATVIKGNLQCAHAMLCCTLRTAYIPQAPAARTYQNPQVPVTSAQHCTRLRSTRLLQGCGTSPAQHQSRAVPRPRCASSGRPTHEPTAALQGEPLGRLLVDQPRPMLLVLRLGHPHLRMRRGGRQGGGRARGTGARPARAAGACLEPGACGAPGGACEPTTRRLPAAALSHMPCPLPCPSPTSLASL